MNHPNRNRPITEYHIARRMSDRYFILRNGQLFNLNNYGKATNFAFKQRSAALNQFRRQAHCNAEVTLFDSLHGEEFDGEKWTAVKWELLERPAILDRTEHPASDQAQ